MEHQTEQRTEAGRARRNEWNREYQRRRRLERVPAYVRRLGRMADYLKAQTAEAHAFRAEVRSWSEAKLERKTRERAAKSVLEWSMAPDRALAEARETFRQLRRPVRLRGEKVDTSGGS